MVCLKASEIKLILTSAQYLNVRPPGNSLHAAWNSTVEEKEEANVRK